ncbi:long-chain-fatty-acid--CoA ligase [Casimicrobium huifangae]|uniref:long-chain-fatty-acid--CoA ligase n=1 Tax=Casimicrobium huifangae TaxID=2591109 RepID=UPI0012EBB24A|nr:long-chain-fatty-acid--CoA ligase [Casimicrobium huifangae]
MDKPWLNNYPAGVPATIKYDQYSSIVQLLEESFQKYAHRAAFNSMGKNVTYGEVDELSRALGAYLQSVGLQPGDRVACMMPNVIQYPVSVAAILRAGFVVVNVNPLYTPRELEHQLKDSGAKAIVILENFGATLQQVLDKTPVKHVILAAMGDMLGFIKGSLVNYVVRKKKKLVPPFSLPTAVKFNDAIARGKPLALSPSKAKFEDPAVLQYTGGTTGVSKGATLLHRNIVANVLQSEAWMQPALTNPKKPKPPEQLTTVCALPLYHIFAFTVCFLLAVRTGGLVILIPNARDFPGTIKALKGFKIHMFPAVNTLYNALLNEPSFKELDVSDMRVANGGGMAVQKAVADKWLAATGCPIVEGYGLSETSPSATCNPTDTDAYSGTIGLPLPSTEIAIRDDDNKDVKQGEPGEICIRGPQVMAGYWQRPDETAKVFAPDGFFKTGDIGVMDERGYVKIVDRKKDMVLVSGFNVYPNEVEDVVASCPGVLECAVIGVPDEKSGEAVKVFIVKKDPALTEQQVRDYCEANLAGYKKPKYIVFRADLPKTPVGKILRRELRDMEKKAA